MKLSYNTEYINKLKYAEEGQPNPMQWELGVMVDDGVTIVTKPFVCKDFLNEVVASYHTKQDFNVYGFVTDNKVMALHELPHLPLVVSKTTEAFIENMKVVNTYLEEKGFPTIELVQCDKKWFIPLPLKYLESTFYMSHITLYIRCASVAKVVQSMDELLEQQHIRDKTKLQMALKEKQIDKFPEENKKYVSYYGGSGWKQEWKDVVTDNGYKIHNCGLINWNLNT